MKKAVNFSRFAAMVLSLSAMAFGQAVVEYSTTTAAGSAGAASGGKGVSKSIGGIFDGLNKTLGKVGDPDSAKSEKGTSQIVSPPQTVTAPASAAAAPDEHKARKLVRSEEIKLGMARSALVDQFGKPFMKMSSVEGPQFVETYYYQGSDDIVVVTLTEGKVTGVSPPPAKSEPQKTASR